MANLDTPSKRCSSVGMLLFSILGGPFPPDGTIDQGDRQDIAVSYSGILAGAPDVEGDHISVRGSISRYIRVSGRVSRTITLRGKI